MTITSVWFCPACGKKHKYVDAESYDYSMHCHCPHCSAKFIVDVWSTEMHEDDEE